MKKGKILLFLLALAFATGAKAQQQQPQPTLEFVMELRVKIDKPFSVGRTPHGQRTVIPILGGTFEGPLLKGEILSGGADYQMSDELTHRTEIEAIYCIRTDDGVNIHIRNAGLITMGEGGAYFFTTPHFEAPHGSKYEFLNNAIFVCRPGNSTMEYLSLLVWKVK
jgi:Protein of unknown function (DUF3237).